MNESSLSDLAIVEQQVTVDRTLVGDSDRPEHLDVLAGLLMRRFELQGKPDDLKRAIKNQRTAVDLTPAGDSERPGRLSVLRWMRMHRFELEKWLDDPDKAIKNRRAAVDLTPAGDSGRPGRLSVLRRIRMRRSEHKKWLDDFDKAIKNQQAIVDLTPVGDSDRPERLDVLAGLLMRRFERQGRPDDLERVIKNRQAIVDLTPVGDSDGPERLDVLAGLLMRRFERQGKLDDLERAIKNQRAAVDLTPAGDSERPGRLSVLAGLFTGCFEDQGIPDDLNEAIQYQQAAVDLTPAGDPKKRGRLDVFGELLMRRFEREDELDDLDEAIKNQQAVVDLTPAGNSDMLERLNILGELLMRRFESKGALDDLDRVIWIHRLAMVLTPVDDYTPQRSRDLESLLERRLQKVGDPNSEIGSSLRASVIVPTTLGGTKTIYEIIKNKLFEDLQQLSICIKRSKHRELVTTIRRMENAILCLKLQDGDQLCQDIFKASTRLGAYCQALRNRAGDETNQQELEDLYKEFVSIEREFSAAHDRINAKYEQLYKQWKVERQSISKFLSKVDSPMSQSDNQEGRALLEQVDDGFERMGTVLKNEANDLKNLSETLNRLARHPMLVHLSPDPPIVSSDPAQVPPRPPDSPSTPSDLSKQIDDSMETLSRLDALVEKSRYTKARNIISSKSSKTTQRLKKLRTSSEDYDQESRSLSCLRTRRNDNSRDICNRQLELCNQMTNLVGGMQRMLKAIVKGFSGCKASIQGLVFRSLGDLLCDLEPYLPRAGLEVSRKGLHPDLILYEAAFQAIADSIPAHSKLLEGSLSVLDKLRGV